ncbi:MAG TPA: tetratricopeptide repeat protein, partial [Myxococcales bacterium]|nr:tetratricopeptide repeat protein [Myxococcales bacterium]
GRTLAAWADPDLQSSWNRFHALSTFDRRAVWTEIGEARVYLLWKTLDQAKAALDRAAALHTDVAELHVLRGEWLRLSGQPDAAAAEQRRALALRPADPFALDELGTLAAARGDRAEARRCFGEARAAWPDDFTAWQGLLELDAAAGDGQAQLADLDALHRLAPQDLSLWLRSGKLREQQGDSAGAARDYQAALERGSEDPEVLRALARSYRQQGRDADERKVLGELVAQKENGDDLRRLAELELKAGDAKAAAHEYQRAVALNAKDLEAQLALARLQAAAGALREAIGGYRAVIAGKPEAKPELEALEAQAQLAKRPLAGSLLKINSALGAELDKLYRALLEKKPQLAGQLRLRVVVRADGTVEQEELLDDSVGDPRLAANLYWNAHDAHFPHADGKYVFKFDLKPPP